MTDRARPVASLSLDLDNHWTYLKTIGRPEWESLPSFLDTVVPRALALFDRLGLRITCFVVGQDAALPANRELFRSVADAGHEIGNHSFHHDPWLHLYDARRLETEIVSAADALQAVTGVRPCGFRGPGFSITDAALEILARRGYEYDASTFPSILSPLARLCYFRNVPLTEEQKHERRHLGGALRDGFAKNRPHLRQTPSGRLVELPVTTMPGLRLPFHGSYLQALNRYSPSLAFAYFRLALGQCRLSGAQPSLLLHPTDLLGCDDGYDMSYFPGMEVPVTRKLQLLENVLRHLMSRYVVVTLAEHAAEVRAG